MQCRRATRRACGYLRCRALAAERRSQPSGEGHPCSIDIYSRRRTVGVAALCAVYTSAARAQVYFEKPDADRLMSGEIDFKPALAHGSLRPLGGRLGVRRMAGDRHVRGPHRDSPLSRQRCNLDGPVCADWGDLQLAAQRSPPTAPGRGSARVRIPPESSWRGRRTTVRRGHHRSPSVQAARVTIRGRTWPPTAQAIGSLWRTPSTAEFGAVAFSDNGLTWTVPVPISADGGAYPRIDTDSAGRWVGGVAHVVQTSGPQPRTIMDRRGQRRHH